MTAELATIEGGLVGFLPPPLRARLARRIHDDAESLAVAEEVSTKLAEGAVARDPIASSLTRRMTSSPMRACSRLLRRRLTVERACGQERWRV
jgi:hypothetical protein